MNVGLYMHYPLVFETADSARIISHYGMLVEELARQVGRVTLYGHDEKPSGTEDYVLEPPLVRCVDLGPMRSFPARTFNPAPALRNFSPKRDGLDVVMVRGASPLLPALVKASRDVPVAVHLQGEYGGRSLARTNPSWRRLLIALWTHIYNAQQRRAIRGTLVLVHGKVLLPRLGKGAADAIEVFTSTIREADFAEPAKSPIWPASKGRDEPLRMAFSGRIVEEKGLFETVQALRLLADRGWNVELDLIGWDDADPTSGNLRHAAAELGVADRIGFRGYAPAGPQLLRLYRESDVFVLPSYSEGGIPQSLLEALCVGLPAIVTTAGGLRDRLRAGEDVLVIEPRSARAVADAVESLLQDPELRARITANGRQTASELTIERSCALIARHLREWVDAHRAASRTGSTA